MLLTLAVALPVGASAQILQSTNYTLNTSLGGTTSGSGSSTSYKLSDTAGQPTSGSGGSPDYLLTTGYSSQLSNSLQLTVEPHDTYAYWPFDTGTGTIAYDASETGDDATLMNSPTWTTGIVGQAVTLDGSTQYATTADQVSGPTTFTIECWFKSTSATGGYLMGFGSAASGASTSLDRLIYLTNSGQVSFGTNPGTYDVITTSASYNDGSWHHVAASLGAAGMALYVDGIKEATNKTVTTAGSYSGYWRMGYDNLAGWPSAPTSNYLAATIDEAHVYTDQLSDAQVTSDYTQGANGLTDGFVLPNVSPGISQTYLVDAVIRTSAPGYDLYVQRPQPLTHTGGTATIPDITGSIASPSAWTEGTTKGFGFTLTGGTGLEAKWGTSPSYDYAALPSLATDFHSVDGLTDPATDTTTIQYRVDTTPQQQQGTYSTEVIYTATMKP